MADKEVIVFLSAIQIAPIPNFVFSILFDVRA